MRFHRKRSPKIMFHLLFWVVFESCLLLCDVEGVWADDQYSRLGRLNLNTDPRYSRWPNANYVPYQISVSDYTPVDIGLIRDAMDQIFLDSLGCVRFMEYDSHADTGKDYIIISPAIDGTCWSYPGLLPSGGSGQKLGISPGINGCLHSKRLVMKTLFHVLGKRSEHNRPDRDDYLNMHLENLDPIFVPFNPYQKYLDSTVYYQGFPYDYNSVTHHLPTAYAKAGTVIFDVIDSSKTIGDKGRLSYWDCYAMSMLYQCQDVMKNDLCKNVDSYKPTITVLAGVPGRFSGVRPDAVTPASTSTTPTTTTTTTATTEATTTTPTTPVTITTTSTTPIPTTDTTSTEAVNVDALLANPEIQGNLIADNSKADYITMQQRKSALVRKNICDPGFRADAAVQSQDGRIIVFSGSDYYIITTAGYVRDGPSPISRDFPDIPALPITAAFSTLDREQKTTHIISAQNDYTYVDLTFLDYLPIVEDDLLLPSLRTMFTLPDPSNPGSSFEYRIFNGADPGMQFLQVGSRGKKIPLKNSRFFLGNSSIAATMVDAVVSFKLGSLGNTVDVALVFSGDQMYLMDVDYSCLPILRFPCLNSSKRPRFPLPIRNVLNCSAYAMARSYSGAAAARI